MTKEELLNEQKVVLDALDTVLEMIGYFADLGDPAPHGTVHYLWNKKFKLEELIMESNNA